jgi:hypothetical protein
MSSRFYFSDPSGRELVEHPLNGCEFEGTGPYVNGDRGAHAVIRTPGKPEPGKDWGPAREITIDDFPGHAFVNVKWWWPNGQHKYFRLVREIEPGRVWWKRECFDDPETNDSGVYGNWLEFEESEPEIARILPNEPGASLVMTRELLRLSWSVEESE